MAEVTVFTWAHNPGKFIYPCVDSVLNQTFRDFEYVIIDNASSDGTKEILEAYAEKDDRIRLIRNEENIREMVSVIEKQAHTEYYMILDHDDYLEPEALELLYTAARREDLDMVFGCCEMVDANGSALGDAGIKADLPCIKAEQLWEVFDRLYWQMRTQWGKLIRKDLLKYIDYETLKKRSPSKYAGDTVMILSMAFGAKRLGTVGKVLHHYRILEQSESRTYCRERFLADWVLLDMGRQLLLDRNGLSIRNEIYLFQVYCNAILDTMRMAMKSDISLIQKMEVLTEIVVKEHTSEMVGILRQYASEEYNGFEKSFGQAIGNLFLECSWESACKNLMYQWLLLLYGTENFSEEEFSFLYEKSKTVMLLLCFGQGQQAYEAMQGTDCPKQCPALYLSLALVFEKDIQRMAQVLLTVGKENFSLYERAENAIEILIRQNALLCVADESDLKRNPDIVAAICAGECESALERCLVVLSGQEWQRSSGILEVSISLAALLECADLFVMLNKCSCEFLIHEGKTEEATKVLGDLVEMCPEDEEVTMLRSLLEDGI